MRLEELYYILVSENLSEKIFKKTGLKPDFFILKY